MSARHNGGTGRGRRLQHGPRFDDGRCRLPSGAWRLVYLTTYEGVDVWTAEADGTSYLFTVTPDGYARAASAPDSLFQLHGITIGLSGERGVTEHFVLLPDALPAVSAPSDLEALTDRLYVDKAFDSRASNKVVELSPTLEIGLSARRG
jgi:hypothetical protein